MSDIIFFDNSIKTSNLHKDLLIKKKCMNFFVLESCFLSISACLVLVAALITVECCMSSCIKVMCTKEFSL